MLLVLPPVVRPGPTWTVATALGSMLGSVAVAAPPRSPVVRYISVTGDHLYTPKWKMGRPSRGAPRRLRGRLRHEIPADIFASRAREAELSHLLLLCCRLLSFFVVSFLALFRLPSACAGAGANLEDRVFAKVLSIFALQPFWPKTLKNNVNTSSEQKLRPRRKAHPEKTLRNLPNMVHQGANVAPRIDPEGV